MNIKEAFFKTYIKPGMSLKDMDVSSLENIDLRRLFNIWGIPSQLGRTMNIKEAFFKTYIKPLPLWRRLFCSFESNLKWYERRLQKFLK